MLNSVGYTDFVNQPRSSLRADSRDVGKHIARVCTQATRKQNEIELNVVTAACVQAKNAERLYAGYVVFVMQVSI